MCEALLCVRGMLGRGQLRHRQRCSRNMDPSHMPSVDALANLDRSPLPQWIEIDRDKFSGKVTAMPSRSDSSADIDEQLIVELYSK